MSISTAFIVKFCNMPRHASHKTPKPILGELMDDNARQHRARIVQHFIQQEAVQKIPWLAVSPDMNPIEHVWNFICRKINQRNPKCHNCYELRTAILQEWQQFPQNRLRRLVRSMTRHVTELHNKRGGYTHY
jgi:transposase